MLVLVTGEQEGQGSGGCWSHPGSGGSSNGLKQALVTSGNSRSALPPSLVPKRVDSERSGAIGVRWAAHARVKRGHCWMMCATGLQVDAAVWASGGLAGVEAGSVFANEGVA